MARRLLVQRQSDLDIQAAALWYEDQRPGLGMRFLSELDEVFKRIESNPKQFTLTKNFDDRRADIRTDRKPNHFPRGGEC